VLTYFEFIQPHCFVPQRTKGICSQRPASGFRLRGRTQKSWPYRGIAGHAGSQHTVGVSGQSLILNANAPNLGSITSSEGVRERAVRAECRRHCRGATGEMPARGARAIVTVFGAPPIDGLGTTGGFQNHYRGSWPSWPGRAPADERSDRRAGNKTGLEGLYNSSRASTPWLYLEIDRTKCMAWVCSERCLSTLQVYLAPTSTTSTSSPNLAGKYPGDTRSGKGPRHPSASGAEQPGQMIRWPVLSGANTSGPVS